MATSAQTSAPEPDAGSASASASASLSVPAMTVSAHSSAFASPSSVSILSFIVMLMTALMTLLYPLLIWLGQGVLEPRWLAGILLLAAMLRLPTLTLNPAARWSAAAVLVLALVLVGLTVWSNALLPLKLYPVAVNSVFLLVFGSSLFVGMPVVEQLARLRDPALPAVAVPYTRRVTLVWCGFFIMNGSIALVMALWASEATWSLYTGVLSYLLMALLFGVEYLFRLRFMRLHQGGV